MREPPRGGGLAPLRSTRDFGEWEEATNRTLGHHRSRLIGQDGFEAHDRIGRAGPLQVLLSFLLPEPLLPGGGSPLLHRGPRAREVVVQAMELARATDRAQPGVEHGALCLLEALRAWQQELNEPERGLPERPGAARARNLVNEGLAWMKERLAEPFTVTELAAGLSTSVRALQYAFNQELGHSPLAEARRQRLRLLRERLLDPKESHVPIGLVMAGCGLLAAGGTAWEYRQVWGELPRETRQHLYLCAPLGRENPSQFPA